VIRFAALQMRMQAAVALGAIVVVAIVLALTGPHLVNLYDTTVVPCSAHNDCAAATTALTDTDGPLQVFLAFLLLVIPVFIGMFWGAPLLAREYESGTYRLAWTQSVTRTRWLAVKLGLGALVSVIVVGLLSLMVTWWWSPLNAVGANPFDPVYFGTRDLTPVGYAAFAFVLGACAGLVMRRTVPAMFTALAGFAAVRYVMNSLVRPHLMAPLHKVIAISPSSPLNMGETPAGFQVSATTRGLLPGDWVYSSQIVDKAGHAPTTAFLDHACPVTLGSAQVNYASCATNLGAKFHELITYQPESRFWTFQLYETAIFLGLAAVVAGICFLWMRRPS
jgi:hypothetical protein